MKAATERPSGNGVAPQGAPGGAMPVTPTRSLGARRRRPALIALSVALIAAGGLGSAAFYQMQNHKVAVLAVARVVPYGATIAAADLQVVEINDAAGLRPIGSGSKSVIVGKRAAVELRPGTLLTSDQVTETVAIKSGEMLVPIAVDSSRMPVRGLTPGTQIVIVTSPVPMGGNNAPTTTPGQIRATVIRSTGFRDSGPTILDVAVPPQDGPLLATRVMEGKFSVVVLNTGNADTPPGTGGAT
ncbi:hypothetical protein GT354_49000 [Streptomyces sp. SID3343]|nr:hypothetical protein [Streptomyces sp. SID3343]